MLVLGVWLGVGAVVPWRRRPPFWRQDALERGAAPGFNRRDSAADALQRHSTMSL
jgi:hypothetical protein